MNIRKKYRQFFYGQCAILLYHRVTRLETDPQLLSVTPENFDDQLKWIRKNFHLLSIDEFVAYLSKRKNLPKRSVVLTFDDGYADNLLEALPVLKSNDAQALFYISTGNLNTSDEFWWDEMERHLLLPKKLPNSLQLNIGGSEIVFPTQTASDFKNTYDKLLPLLRTMIPETRKNTVSQIFEWAGRIPPRSSHRSRTFDEIKLMSKSTSAVIGAHTQSHQSLAALSKDLQMKEILQSKEILEGLTGKNIVHFSYPFGTKRDYNQTTIKICDELGFKWVAANFPDTADLTSSNFQLPRFLVRDWKKEEFGMHLKNFFN